MRLQCERRSGYDVGAMLVDVGSNAGKVFAAMRLR